MAKNKPRKPATEIAVIGDVDDWEEEVIKSLLDLPAGGECVFYIDSAGGSVFGALAVVTLLRQRRLNATACVLGECSSASLLLFAACRQRRVSRFSLFLFHRMRWQSEKRVNAQEALSWARHFHEMENDLDDLQVRLFGRAEDLVRSWTATGQYVTGPQLVTAGLAELLEWE
ncbi:MAG TPA: ATP-dependent Clp protease proteolytic subunit [Gemmataceae bacterium]|nr:ATP-dependent Clp protease proteolytic subunit [Gemmataceae bacterium]